MYFASLLSNQSPVACRYAYYARGTKQPLLPDLIPEAANGNDFTPGQGNLFLGKPVGFSSRALALVGVDIVISLEKPCFFNHVKLTQGEGSCLASVELLSDDAPVGRYQAATGEVTDRREISISVGRQLQTLTVRLDSMLCDVTLDALDICVAQLDDDTLFPLPNHRVNLGGSFPVAQLRQIVTTAPCADMAFAAQLLQEKLQEFHDISLPCGPGEAGAGTIAFACYDEGHANYGIPESYALEIADGAVTIQACDRRGFLYGAEALLMLLENGQLPHVQIVDKPAHPFRGVHIYSLPERKDLEFFKRFVKYYLVPMRLNTLVIEVCGNMRYESHPEITEAWMQASELYRQGKFPPLAHGGCAAQGTLWEKDEVAELVRYIKSFGIDAIPEVQSLGHVQYITFAHPEIAEAEDVQPNANIALVDGASPTERFPAAHCYCPSNPKSKEIILDILDEIIDVFQPEHYVHMGHDEVTELGCCPVCKGKDPNQLLAGHINILHDHLAQKGLKMMIWSDTLQDHTHNPWQYLMHNTLGAGKLIPKDIVMLDFIWYFMLDHDTSDCLLDQGFQVAIGNFYSIYPRFTSRIRKPGIIGGISAIWQNTSEYIFARQGKMFEFAYIAHMLWNDSFAPEHHTTLAHLLARLMTRLRQHIRAEREPACASPILSESALEPLPYDIRSLGLPGVLPVGSEQPRQIPVSGRYSYLAFTHASEKNARRNAWQELVEQGEYLVQYADGTACRIPLEYGGNIGELRRAYGLPLPDRGGAPYRHQSHICTYLSDPVIREKSSQGEDLTVYRYLWKNPHPEKEISAVSVVKNDTSDGCILLFSLTGEPC